MLMGVGTSARVRMPAPRVQEALRRALLAWFGRARRDLPWRRTREPYAVWISEAMLQQTRVETVVPYYTRFLARFPDVAALASAPEAEVLAAWSGLGYYARARSLRAAARVVVQELGGRWPVTRAGWLALPGVGPYTAGAVLSIAFGRSEALVDGNVQRVFARLFALDARQGSRELLDRCWELARALVPAEGSARDPGAWNQALMELGARVCTVRAPRCGPCPARKVCRAFASGTVAELPRARERRPAREVRLEVLVPRSGGRVLLVRRPARGRMAGLYEFPTRELADETGGAGLWPREHLAGVSRASARPLGQLTHAITHHRIRAVVLAGRARGPVPGVETLWVRPAQALELPLSGLARKTLVLPALVGDGGA